MIQNILAADTEPKKVRRPFPLVFGTVMTGVFAVLLFVMIPRTVNHGVSYDAAPASDREDYAVSDAGVMSAEAVSEEATVMSHAEFEEALGVNVADLMDQEAVRSVEYRINEDGSGTMLVTMDSGTALISAAGKRESVLNAPAETNSYSMMETDSKETNPANEPLELIEHGETIYLIQADPSLNEADLAVLKEALAE